MGQARDVASGSNMANLPVAKVPGHVGAQSKEELEKNTVTVITDEVIKNLTIQPEETKRPSEPGTRDIIFKGTFEEVNKFFYKNKLSEGLPVVPPTMAKVTEFLKFTDHSPGEVIGVYLPDKREATVWNVAVNGVMAGCRPEYMPVLLAIAEALADPKYGLEHSGNTPGSDTLITINGTIIKELGFNYTQGVLRDGFQANTSIGRFLRLMLRNVAGFLLHETDKATFGNTWRVVLAENEDAVAKMGWQPMSVDRGFRAGDNVVTIARHVGGSAFSNVAGTAEEMMSFMADNLERLVGIWAMYLFTVSPDGCTEMPHVVMSPIVAEVLAKAGYSKKDVKKYFFENARIPAWKVERGWKRLQRQYGPTVCDEVKQGHVPKLFCESTDPGRMVPVVCSPDDIMITVSGDPLRNNAIIFAHNGFLGYTTSKKIKLPLNWAELLKEAKKK